MIVEITWDRAVFVSTHMRIDDFREVMANRWDESPYSFAADCMRLPGPKMCCVANDDTPVAIGGIAANIPGVGQAWLVGTDRIGSHGVEMAHACKTLISRLLNDGAMHRIQAFSAEFHSQAHQWLKAIGFSEESRMPRYGKSQENYRVFSIMRGV